MVQEIVIKVAKPETDVEIKNFKKFRLELKSLVTKGKLKSQEKFANYTFTITDCSRDDESSISAFLKRSHPTIEVLQ